MGDIIDHPYNVQRLDCLKETPAFLKVSSIVLMANLSLRMKAKRRVKVSKENIRTDLMEDSRLPVSAKGPTTSSGWTDRHHSTAK